MKKNISLFLVFLSLLIIQWGDDPNISKPVFLSGVRIIFNDAIIQGNLKVFVSAKLNYDSPYIQALDMNGNMLWGNTGKRVSGKHALFLRRSSIIPDGYGGSIVGLEFRETYGSQIKLYAQRIDNNGKLLWGNFGVKVTLKQDSFKYSSAPDGTGGAYFIYYTPEGNYESVYVQRLASNGSRLWGDPGIFIGRSYKNYYFHPNIALVSLNGGEEVIAVWSQMNDGRFEIMAQKINRNGLVQWNESGVCVYSNAQRAANESVKAVEDGKGGAVIAWSDLRKVDFPGIHIYAQRIDSGGDILWNSGGQFVGSTAYIDMFGDYWRRYLEFNLINDNESGYILTWQGSRGLVMQRINAEGIRQWDMNGIVVDENARTYNSVEHSICNMSSGKFMLVWYMGNHLFVNLYDLNGIPIWPERITVIDKNIAYWITGAKVMYDSKKGAVIICQMYGSIIIYSRYPMIRSFYINEEGTGEYLLK